MKSVVIETLIWQGHRGGAVFRAHTLDGSQFRIVASSSVMPRPPLEGEVWDIEGVIKQNPEYGPQVEARIASLQKPVGRLIVRSIASSPLYQGIGPAKAQKLWDAYGEQLYEMLEEGDPKPFEELLGPNLALTLIKGWSESSVEVAAYRWLEKHGLPVWLSKKLLTIYGSDVVGKMEENPYRLLAFQSWSQTDKVGRVLGVPATDFRRMVAGAEAATYHRLNHSHTWTNRDEYLATVGRLLQVDKALAFEATKWAQGASAIVEVGDGFQGLGAWSMERYIASRIKDMVTGKFEAEQRTFRQQPIREGVDEILEQFGSKTGFSLRPAQREAVWTSINNPISCITGGAGVGKTTVLRAVHEVAESLYFSGVYQMALSGRASKRLAEATGRPACTIASFLQRVDCGEITFEGEYLLIVDEASMLDLPTCYRIMRRIPRGTKLLLVGDSAQLPPIGFGLTFHVFVGHLQIPTVELTEIHRAAATTGIPQASVLIRNGIAPVLPSYHGGVDGVSFIDAVGETMLKQIFRVVSELGGDTCCQVISAVKNGPSGIVGINDFFHNRLAVGRPHLHGYCKGEPVMWTVNDCSRGLLNGSLGRVVRTSGQLCIDFDGIQHEMTHSDIRYLVHAYAITVHKSQGSQFGRVVVPVFPSRILDRTLLYTAITRASKQVVLIGDRDAFQKAVRNLPLSSTRETGIRSHLEE